MNKETVYIVRNAMAFNIENEDVERSIRQEYQTQLIATNDQTLPTLTIGAWQLVQTTILAQLEAQAEPYLQAGIYTFIDTEGNIDPVEVEDAMTTVIEYVQAAAHIRSIINRPYVSL